jgi:ammonium transporter, Amt family
VLNQIEGVLIVIVYDVIVSLVLLKIIDVVVGLRVDAEIEQDGLDLALHGETVQ